MKDKIIYEKKITTKGRISFGQTSIKKDIEKISTGIRSDGKEICSSGLMITVYSKPNTKGKREVLYSGPKIYYQGE